uniref:Uncharacterized protein n=1 Tax=viral metagenome TaxID=1070528 RepID=A0A6M3LBR8_9ZZZZ
MTNYVVSNAFNLWSISASSSGDGKAAIVDRGRAFYAGDGNANTLLSLAPGSQIGQHHGTRVRIPSNVLSFGGATGILTSAPGYPTNNFGTMTAGSYVMKRVTTTLAGVANTFLRSGSSYLSGRRSINKLEAVRTWQVAKAIRAGNWNVFTGKFSSALNATEDAYTPSANNVYSAFDQQAGLGATSGTLDDAANPTRAIPGELIIHQGSGAPFRANYSARTTW